MATLSSGSVTITIQAGEQYKFVATGEAYVDIGGGSYQSYRLTGGAKERIIDGITVATPVTVRIVTGSVDYFNITGNGISIPLSLAQSSRTDITGVVASTESGDYVLANGSVVYGPRTWATMPTAASAPGAVIRCTNIGNSPAGTMLISDGVYWRPVGGQVHIVQRSGSPFLPLKQNTGVAGFNFTLPVPAVIPANFLIPGESQIECEVWVRKVGGNGTATLNVFLGLNNSNSTDYRIIQGTFASADGSDIGLRPLVTVAQATRFSSTTFLTVGSVSPQTNAGTDSAAGMCNVAVPNYLTINVGSANAADTFRLVAYRLTVRQ